MGDSHTLILCTGTVIGAFLGSPIVDRLFPTKSEGTEEVEAISLEFNGPICEYEKGDFSESSVLLSVVNSNKLQGLGAQIGDEVTVTIAGNDFSDFVQGLKLGTDSTMGKCVVRMERVIFKGLDSQLVEELEVDLDQRNDYHFTITVD